MTDPEKPKRKKPKKTSPTERSLKHLRERGYHVAIVEHWNPHVGIRQDMFGFVDLVAVPKSGCGEPPSILAVQTTAADVSGRVAKIRALDAESGIARDWLLSGNRIEVHGWTTKRSRAKNQDGARSKAQEVRQRTISLGLNLGAIPPVLTSCELAGPL